VFEQEAAVENEARWDLCASLAERSKAATLMQEGKEYVLARYCGKNFF
jgi:hypothetical protein